MKRNIEITTPASWIAKTYFEGAGNYIIGYLVDNEFVKTIKIYANTVAELVEKWMNLAKNVLNVKVNDMTYIERIRL